MSAYPVARGETGTVGVIDCKVKHIAGEQWTLCGRWWVANLWGTKGPGRRGRLPLCKKCAQEQALGKK